jgi:hypothetical protein
MSTETNVRIWISKYALSGSLIEAEADIKEGTATVQRNGNGWCDYFHAEGKEWHRTREGAEARAEAMRVAKIASLRKQIAKLEAMTFEEKRA